MIKFFSKSCILIVSFFLVSVNFATDKTKLLTKKWKFVHIEIPSLEKYLEKANTHEKMNLYNQLKKELVSSYIDFKANGKYEAQIMYQGPISGTWKLKPNELSIIVKMDSAEKEGELEIVALNKKELVILGAKDESGKKVKMFLVPDTN